MSVNSLALYMEFARAKHMSLGVDTRITFHNADTEGLDEINNTLQRQAETLVPLTAKVVKVDERTTDAVKKALSGTKVMVLL